MDAILRKTGTLYTLTLARTLPHPPSALWSALTEPERLSSWFPCDIQGEWKTGAPLHFVFRHGEGDGLSEDELRGEVLAVNEPHYLRFRWGTHVLTHQVEDAREGSRLTLSETFEDPSWGARNAAGWEMCLDNLSLALDGAPPREFAAPVWKMKFRRYVQAFEPEFGPQDDPTGVHPLLSEEGPPV